MDHSAAISHGAHPAPHRHRVGFVPLILALIAPPLAWSVHLVVNYGFSSRACFPDGTPQPLPAISALWWVLITVDIASLAVSAIAALTAYRSWILSAEEQADTGSPMVETGEGRTRFLAIWGLLIGIWFFIAVGFDFIGLWILPLCS
jgi:hypothetical protein